MCLDVASKLFFILMCVCRGMVRKREEGEGGRGGRGGEGWREEGGVEKDGEGLRDGGGVEGGEGWWGSGNKVRFITKS